MVRKPAGQIFKGPKVQFCSITATISDENFSEYVIKNAFFVNGKHGAANRAKTDFNKCSITARIRSLGRTNNHLNFGTFSHIWLCLSTRQLKMLRTGLLLTKILY